MQISMSMIEALLPESHDLDDILEHAMALNPVAIADVDSALEALSAAVAEGGASWEELIDSGMVEGLVGGLDAGGLARHRPPDVLFEPAPPAEVERYDDSPEEVSEQSAAVESEEYVAERYDDSPEEVNEQSAVVESEEYVAERYDDSPEEASEQSAVAESEEYVAERYDNSPEEASEQSAVVLSEEYRVEPSEPLPLVDLAEALSGAIAAEPVSVQELIAEPDDIEEEESTFERQLPYQANEATVVSPPEADPRLDPGEQEEQFGSERPAKDTPDTGLLAAIVFDDEPDDGPVINPDEISGLLDDLFDTTEGQGANVSQWTTPLEESPHAGVDMSMWQPGGEMPPLGVVDAPEELSVEIRHVPLTDQVPKLNVQGLHLGGEMPPLGFADAPEELSVEIQRPPVEAPLHQVLEQQPGGLDAGDGYLEVSPADIAEIEAIADEGLHGVDEYDASDDQRFYEAGDPLDADTFDPSTDDLMGTEPLAEVISADDIAEEIALDDFEQEPFDPDLAPAGESALDGAPDPTRFPPRPSEVDQALEALIRGDVPHDDHSSPSSIEDLRHGKISDAGEPASTSSVFGNGSFLSTLDQDTRGFEKHAIDGAGSTQSQSGTFSDWIPDRPLSEDDATPVESRPQPWSSELDAGSGAGHFPMELQEEQTQVSTPESASAAPRESGGAAGQEESLVLAQPPLGKAEPKKRKSFFRKLFGGND